MRSRMPGSAWSRSHVGGSMMCASASWTMRPVLYGMAFPPESSLLAERYGAPRRTRKAGKLVGQMRRFSTMNYYAILGVTSYASKDEIKAKYRVLARKTHPDAGGDPERFAQIA